MIPVQFLSPNFKVEYRENVPYIFDTIRKRWLVLQDEEWVRQNFVAYLIHSLNYPKEFVALEKEIYVGELKKRFDILVYDKHHNPWMLVECKSYKIKLQDAVINQILRYHISIPAKFLIITNGKYTLGWQKINYVMNEIIKMPDFPLE